MLFKSTVIFLVTVSSSLGWRPAFDLDLYDEVLDPELCQLQLQLIDENNLVALFADLSGKIPTGIAYGNANDFGDYYQCLEVSLNLNDTLIEGKYSGVLFPLENFDVPEFPSLPEIPGITDLPEIPGLFPSSSTTAATTVEDTTTEVTTVFTTEVESTTEEDESATVSFQLNDQLLKRAKYDAKTAREAMAIHAWAQIMAGVGKPSPAYNNNTRVIPMFISFEFGGLLGVCVPKACTATEALDFFEDRYGFLNLTYNEYYYRLPNDKPLSPADYVAFSLFSIILISVIVSTSYDLYCTFSTKRAPNKTLCCFSIYTNTRRFLTFNTIPNSLECVDGIRAISMLWVVVGHTYSMTLLGYVRNIFEALEWLRLFTSTWVNSAPLTVDTFFLLSGILAVYSTVGKISQARFIRTVHLFYINRLLRMFPLLATVILLQASVFNYISDGPFWQNVAVATENCRRYWWSALLHVQNYVNPLETCLPQTWYLSVDTQLYFICPLILVWMFHTPRLAWIALSVILTLSLVSASVYSFTYNFTAALVQPNRILEFRDYLQVYYFNTLTRAPPFFIGMMYGYVLHQCRGKKVKINKYIVAALWCFAFALMAFCVFSIYPVMQLDWDKQAFDNFLNAYMRSLWAAGLGWIIFACVHGYGGPVNWFLSLSLWKLPARLSFAMYLIHLPLIMIANASWAQTHYFTNGDNIYRFMADVSLTFVAAFILCILIDAPFSTLQKLLMGGGKRRPVQKAKTESQENIVDAEEATIEKTSL